MDKCVYAGRLYRFKKPRVGEGHWKETWAILDSDANLVWFNDKTCSQEKGRINVHHHPKSLVVGREVKKNSLVPPPIPVKEGSENGYLAVVFKKKKDEVHWFYLKSEADTHQWLEALATSLNKKKSFQRLVSESKRESADKSADEQRLSRVGMGDEADAPSDWAELWHSVLKSPEDSKGSGGNGASEHKHHRHHRHHKHRTGSKASSSIASSHHEDSHQLNGGTVESHLTVVADVHEESTNDGSSD